MKEYQGNCIEILDTEALNGIMSDATEMAQIIEESVEITKEEFINIVEPKYFLVNITNHSSSIFLFHPNYDLYILYNEDSDIHYFFH